MQPHEQAQFLTAISKFVKEQVAAATVPLLDRISVLERSHRTDYFSVLDAAKATVAPFHETVESIDERLKKLEDRPAPSDGKDGQSVTVADVTPMIEECLARNVKNIKEHVEDHLNSIPKPVDGKDGRDGKDGSSVDLDEVVKELASLIPTPKDGKDGRDGTDGKSVTPDEIASLVARAIDQLPVPRHVVGGHIDRDGDLHHVFSDGSTLSLGKVVGRDGVDGKDGASVKGEPGENGKDGKDGADGKNGADGLGFKDMSVTFDGERDFVFKFVLDDRTEELALTIPFQIYRGVWKSQEYKRGDTVSRDGSQWVAVRDTKDQPGAEDSGWQLCVKRGRDGKDGEPGKSVKGEQGKPGRDGRDLTQIGPDGRKWG